MFKLKTKKDELLKYLDEDKPAVMEVNVFIRAAILMVVGVVILSAVVAAVSLGENSPFASVLDTTVSGIESGYSLLVIILIVIAAAGILRYLNII